MEICLNSIENINEKNIVPQHLNYFFNRKKFDKCINEIKMITEIQWLPIEYEIISIQITHHKIWIIHFQVGKFIFTTQIEN